jgi:hypothetical protein
MPRYLIESPHDESKKACELAVSTFLETGSHFMTNADWGCGDGVHKAWIIVELESREEAMQLLPPAYRNGAVVVELQKFSLDDIDATLGVHHD